MFSLFSQYPTYQLLLAFIVSMALTMVVMPFFIRLLKHREIGQQVRADGPQGHLVKQGTPTMGGVIILLMMSASVFLVGVPDVSLILVLAATLLTGALGFIDDASKVAKERSLGLLPYQKMAALTIISVAFCLIAVNVVGIAPTVRIPLVNFDIDLGVLTTVIPLAGGIKIPWLYVVFVFLLIAGMSNAVNLTDGLDGLASGVSLPVCLFFVAVTFVWGETYLEQGIYVSALLGGLVGFLTIHIYTA